MEIGRDLVVIGASAGGLEALRAVVARLPTDLAAAVLVVTHLPADGSSQLAAILDRAGPLPARPAVDGAALTPGRIAVAVPDRHLLVHGDRIRLGDGPRQNRSRPAIDALFRSAARWRGRRTVGVVLSGGLDDGATGLATIEMSGGVAVVQDPADALFPGMPTAAIAVTTAPSVCAARDLAAAIVRHVAEVVHWTGPAADRDLQVEAAMAEDATWNLPQPPPGRPVPVSCPDCTGGMRAVGSDRTGHYLCHVGHAWSPLNLLAAQREKTEHAIWTAISMLEEQATVHDQLAARAAAAGAILTETHQIAAAREVRTAALVIRKHFPGVDADLDPEAPLDFDVSGRR